MDKKHNSENITFNIEKYRWIILIVFMFVTIMTQINWITFAPIMNEVAGFYNVSPDMILLLTASYMIIYIPVNFPATWLIDKYGLKWGIGIGVFLLGVFGFLRGLSGNNFTILFIAQIMTAVAQPFLLNSFTKIAITWFPENEKTLATGLGTMSILVGIIIGMLLTPYLFQSQSITFVLQIYGFFSLLSMIIYFVFIKNSPKSPANQFTGQKAFNYEGFMKVFSNSKFNILLILIFVGLGAFNAITSEVDDIFIRFTEPEASGIIGGMMIIGGILGAGILSTISDMTKKRVIFLKLAMIIATPSTILLVVVNDFNLIILSAFIFGFFLVSALPVSLIYASEITYPVSEETSNGIMMTLGQISGLLLLIEFNMYVISFLFLVSTLLSFFLKDYIPEKAPNVS